MDNASIHANAPTATGRNNGLNRHGKPKRFRLKLKHIPLIIVSMIIVAIISAMVLFFYRSSTSSTIDSGKYQAVFFTNGQVYFGKLHTLNSEYMRLTHIWYLQTKSASSSDNPQATSEQANTDVQLVKLGNEVHGPEDQMIISKSQILFFENLKTDGNVTQSIDQHNKQNKQ